MSTGPVVTPLDPAKQARTDSEIDHMGYFAHLLRGADIFGDEILGGQMDETASSRLARWATEEPEGSVRWHIGQAAMKMLNVVDKDHGAAAEEADKERAKDVIAVEDQAQQVLDEEPPSAS